ncbi:hypothetical protein UY3_03339 [Chelonia mydas]|uniref:Uncharacterized protein n=1 Tax=Chelonia mydas TaxID=8469 RepID=M7BNH3_CHEMY|nr:hypothetical protein UY3_03339 [Chelonia mydas]
MLRSELESEKEMLRSELESEKEMLRSELESEKERLRSELESEKGWRSAQLYAGTVHSVDILSMVRPTSPQSSVLLSLHRAFSYDIQ